MKLYKARNGLIYTEALFEGTIEECQHFAAAEEGGGFEWWWYVEDGDDTPLWWCQRAGLTSYLMEKADTGVLYAWVHDAYYEGPSYEQYVIITKPEKFTKMI